MSRFARAAIAVILLVSSASVSIAARETFRARGNEPFWSVEKTTEAIIFTPMDGAPVTVSPVPAPRADRNAEIYEATAGDERFVLTIAGAVCTDTMSGMPFPKSVTVVLGDKTLSGCGGEPVSLLLGEWMIAEIDGKPAVAGSTPTVKFEAEGRLSGHGSCNRFFGGYALSGEGLTTGDVGSSMMMCDQPLMDQETAILDVLKGLGGFGIGEDGSLILRAGDGRTIIARPVA